MSIDVHKIHQEMLSLLPSAAEYARPPVSRFAVGAVVRGKSGRLYYGANMEFPGVALGFSIHAEQAAVSHAWHQGERGITHLAVSAPPCGLCRQFLMELEGGADLTILLPDEEPLALSSLLSRPFGPGDLGISRRLMDGAATPLEKTHLPKNPSPAVRRAFEAAKQSYAPYSHTLAGVALELEDGSILTGRYAENAAFNPSFSPMAAALSLKILEGKETLSVRGAVLVEAGGTLTSHRGFCAAMLASQYPGVVLDYFSV